MRVMFVAACVGCGGNAAAPIKTPYELTKAHAKWANGVASAQEIVLYEGLPHQEYDTEALKKDLKEKKTVQLHGFPFYAEALSLSDEDAAELKRLALDSSSYILATGNKKCGGFHPDYCVEWLSGGVPSRMLICFGCGEVKFYGPKIELYCDFHDGRNGLAQVLRKYQKNRRSWQGLYSGQAPGLNR